VSFQGDRGWVSGQDLEIFFHNRRVRIVDVEPAFVPVERFEVATYWQRHYRSKPFFGDRNRFASVNININGRTKAVSGRAGRVGEVAVTHGGVGSNFTEARTGRGSANRHFFANRNMCPAGQKNCMNKGNAGLNGIKKPSADVAGAVSKDKTASLTNRGAVTGSIGGKGNQKKKCQPGMACVQNPHGVPAPAQ